MIGGFLDWLSNSLFGRLWKRVLRTLTGKCELQRICENRPLGSARTLEIERSLRSSKFSELRRMTDDPDANVNSSTQEILRIKDVSAEKYPEFPQALGVCLTQIISVSNILQEVQTLRVEKYSESNPQHEKQLLELWDFLMPGHELKARYSDQWKEIGFQGNNPATDFRGMGILGLQNLCFFAKKHKSVARQLLSHSNHPKLGYSFAVVGINLTSLLVELFESQSLRVHFYNASSSGDPTMEHFHEAYCYVFTEFDRYWREKEPENILAFTRIRDELRTLLKNRLLLDPQTTFLLDEC